MPRGHRGLASPLLCIQTILFTNMAIIVHGLCVAIATGPSSGPLTFLTLNFQGNFAPRAIPGITDSMEQENHSTV